MPQFTSTENLASRLSDDAKAFKAKDMLHLSLSLRGKTGNYRFSIPGIPSLYSGGVPKFVEENIFEITIPIENVPELQVGGNINLETSRVPKSAEECRRYKN